MATPTNDDAYAAGLLIRALDPAPQPPEIRAYFAAEIGLLEARIATGMRVLDVGCGTGRHLHHLAPRLGLGVGVDYERSYLSQALRRPTPRVHFVLGDAAAIPLTTTFDLAVCTTNTWGTMGDKLGVLREMRRLAPAPGTRLLSVWSTASVPARKRWYPKIGHEVVAESEEYLETAGGLRSEHFSEARLRRLVGDCDIVPLAAVAYLVTF